MSCAFVVKAGPPEEGKTIFNTRCRTCHSIDKSLVGPALAGVEERHPIEWIVKFVHSSQTVIKSGDETAIALFEKFNKVQMPDHPDLTEENIKSIVAYISSETKAAAEEKARLEKESSRPAGRRVFSSTKDLDLFLAGLFTLTVISVTLWLAIWTIKKKRSLKI
ncbi:MAG TPA: cytochrome c [Chitinophagaceae bacterium]|nr:cytochrome c [Chitinophagaceae bacterium]